MSEPDESAVLRKKLLKLDKPELAKKCKRKSLAASGTKMDMVDRLIEYNEENGGVSAAREGSNANKKKSDTSSGGGKKRSKSGGGGGGGGRSGGSRGEGGGGGGRSNTRNGGGGGGGGGGVQCYCGGGDNDGGNGVNNKRLLGGVLGVICIILFIVAMAVNTLSRYTSNTVNVKCRWNEVRGCDANDNCMTISFDSRCDECDNGECNSCDTKTGGECWLAFNILGLIILLIGVIGIFAGKFNEKASGFVTWMKIFYIISAIFAFIAIISWVGANNYDQSCYDVDNDLGLGASNIIDIVIGIVLIIGFILVF